MNTTTVYTIHTSPIKYFRLFHGILVSLALWAFVKYVDNICKHTVKSDSLKSQQIFHPNLSYFLRSCGKTKMKLETKHSSTERTIEKIRTLKLIKLNNGIDLLQLHSWIFSNNFQEHEINSDSFTYKQLLFISIVLSSL